MAQPDSEPGQGPPEPKIVARARALNVSLEVLGHRRADSAGTRPDSRPRQPAGGSESRFPGLRAEQRPPPSRLASGQLPGHWSGLQQRCSAGRAARAVAPRHRALAIARAARRCHRNRSCSQPDFSSESASQPRRGPDASTAAPGRRPSRKPRDPAAGRSPTGAGP